MAQASSVSLVEDKREKGLEVPRMVVPVGEYAVQQLKEFEGKKLTKGQNICVHTPYIDGKCGKPITHLVTGGCKRPNEMLPYCSNAVQVLDTCKSQNEI